MDKEIKFLIYNNELENINVKVIVKNETIWVTQKVMTELFDVNKSAISKHLKNIYLENELEEKATVSKMETVQNEGDRTVKRLVEFYNLDVVIAVGYRVNTKKATSFRIWATSVLKEYIKKGFVMNDERLKQGEALFGKDYFRELLERVRSIRASERRIWQQITDIFAECSIDYDKNSKVTQDFYAMIQNKFHYAITGKTSAEIIYSNADANKMNMGLSTWKNSPSGRILKGDVNIAKNYLSANEIKRLERAISGYFDYIEDLIENESHFTMEEFSKSVNEFISFRKFNLLINKGKISKEMADKKAFEEYELYNKIQTITSDFDLMLEELKDKEKIK